MLNELILDMEQTFVEYKDWIEGEVDKHTQQAYDKALKEFHTLRPFEESLVSYLYPPRSSN